jgi:uncharacterized protein YkwD
MKLKLSYLFLAFAMLTPQGILAAGEITLDDEELEFLRIINEYREANGAPCLTPSPTMNEAATYLSGAMGEQGFFDHNEPPCDDAGDICTGRDPFDRITAFGHTQWTSAAENIAAGNAAAAATFEQWRTSPGHNENMLDPGFTSIGIGRVYVDNSYFGWYWTNNFSNWVDGTGDCSGEGGGSGDSGGSGTGQGSGNSGEGTNTDASDSGDPGVDSGVELEDGVAGSCQQSGPTLWMWMLAGVFFLRRKEQKLVRVRIS